jgi:hypothetical protein
MNNEIMKMVMAKRQCEIAIIIIIIIIMANKICV